MGSQGEAGRLGDASDVVDTPGWQMLAYSTDGRLIDRADGLSCLGAAYGEGLMIWLRRPRVTVWLVRVDGGQVVERVLAWERGVPGR